MKKLKSKSDQQAELNFEVENHVWFIKHWKFIFWPCRLDHSRCLPDYKEVFKNYSLVGIFVSLVCVIISMLMQMIYTKFLVDINDWSAVMDTQGSLIFASSVLLIVAITLNGLVLRKSIRNNLE